MYEELDRINAITNAVAATAQAEKVFNDAAQWAEAHPGEDGPMKRANAAYTSLNRAKSHLEVAMKLPLPAMDGPATTQFEKRQQKPQKAAPAQDGKLCDKCQTAEVKGNYNTCFACHTLPSRIVGTCAFCGESAKPEYLSCYSCRQRGATIENTPTPFTTDSQSAMPTAAAVSYNPAEPDYDMTDLPF